MTRQFAYWEYGVARAKFRDQNDANYERAFQDLKPPSTLF